MTPAEAQRALRVRRKATGQCVSCRLPARPGKNKCSACQGRASLSTKRYRHGHRDAFNKAQRGRYRRLAEHRKCVCCGSSSEGTLCGGCSDKKATVQSRSYEKRRRDGACANCGAHSGLTALCSACAQRNRERNGQPAVQRASRQWREQRWAKMLYSTVLARAGKKGIPINISPDDIPDPQGLSCPVFNVPFVMGVGRQGPYSATVDRIDPRLGYVRGNIRLLSALANDVKSNADPETVTRIAEAVIRMESIPPGLREVNDASEDRADLRRLMVRRKRANSKKRGIPFAIGWWNLSLPDRCPCTGLMLDYGGGLGDWRLRPSIDRIDNQGAYVPGNVWIISALANAVKSSATGEQIAAVARWMLQDAKPRTGT